MLTRFMKLNITLLVLFSGVWSQAQGTFQWTVSFDGGPDIQPTDSIGITNYFEHGIGFTPIGSQAVPKQTRDFPATGLPMFMLRSGVH